VLYIAQRAAVGIVFVIPIGVAVSASMDPVDDGTAFWLVCSLVRPAWVWSPVVLLWSWSSHPQSCGRRRLGDVLGGVIALPVRCSGGSLQDVV